MRVKFAIMPSATFTFGRVINWARKPMWYMRGLNFLTLFHFLSYLAMLSRLIWRALQYETLFFSRLFIYTFSNFWVISVWIHTSMAKRSPYSKQISSWVALGLGAEYLVFVSSRSLKTREIYTNWDNLVCLNLYIFRGKCAYFSIFEW